MDIMPRNNKKKAVYNPSGKAGEYARWGCNLFVGCPHRCSYCYLAQGRFAEVLGTEKVHLKKCFRDHDDAIMTAMREISASKEDIIRDGGLFFSFSTDPCLPETFPTNAAVISACLLQGIPVTVLTKAKQWIWTETGRRILSLGNDSAALNVGFTLTGRDDLEPNAPTNAERVEAMEHIRETYPDVRIWVSLEPVIDYCASLDMLRSAVGMVNHVKVGLLTGKGTAGRFKDEDVAGFVEEVNGIVAGRPVTVYFKESVRSHLPKECLEKYESK